MSRRKQAKPQHIHSDEPGENGLPQDGQIEEDGESARKRFRMDDTIVCDKCCAEYFDETEFLNHQKNCTKSQQVVIMKDEDGNEVPNEGLEDFSQDSPDDGPQSDNGQSAINSPSNANAESTERTDEDDGPKSNGEESSKREQAASASPEINYQPSPKPQDSNVTLESMSSTRVAVTQHSSSRAAACAPSLDMLQAIPQILEQLVSLQQQQLQQIQLTEQIRIQVAMMAPQGLHSAMGAAVDPLKALGAHLSQQLSAAAALIGKRTGSQSLSMEAMKQGKLPQPNGIPASLGSMPPKPDMYNKGLSDLAGQLPALLPRSPATMAVPGSVDPSKKAKSSAKTPSMLYETKNGSSSSGGDHTYRHKCKYCGKTFGNDSALQIHLRSHTGERPFKCNICGNRFTTKGNLKVHFQRHKEKYPHIRMNPHPVPEHLDNVPTSSGIPYGMSMPIEESNMVDVKPVIGPPAPSYHPSPMLGFKPSFEAFGGGADPYSQRPSSSGSDGASVSSNVFIGHGQEMGSEQSQESKPSLMGAHMQHMNGSDVSLSLGDHHSSMNRSGVSLGDHHSSGTAKLQQMVDGLEKRTGDPNECVICHRVLSCQSSLKMHYRTHTGERPYKCKICGRAFSTKGNLKAHYGVHRANTPLKMQHSCPICQKKFTNAVVLQQHIRMHMGGQIPNTPLPPDSQYEATAEAMDSSLPDEKSADASGFNESMEDQDAELDSQERLSDASDPLPPPPQSAPPASEEQQQHHAPPSPPPLPHSMFSSNTTLENQQQQHHAPPPPPPPPHSMFSSNTTLENHQPQHHAPPPHSMYSSIAALENHMKNLTSALNLQRQSSTASESDGATRGSSPSSAPREQEYHNGRSPAGVPDSVSFRSSAQREQAYHNGRSPTGVSDSVSFRSSSPVNSYVGSSRSKSPELAAPEDFARHGPLVDPDARHGHSVDPDTGSQEANETDGALDLTAPSGFIPKPIKEEPGLPFSNGEYGKEYSKEYAPSHMPFMRMMPSLASMEMQIPSESPLGAHGVFGSHLPQGPMGIGSSNSSSAPRRSTKQHLCNACGKNFSSASALQIHERTHTGEKPFACTICGRAFTTKGNLKVHVGTHMWNTSSRRGQRLSLDNPMALMALGSESSMMPDMMPPPPKELPHSPMNFDQSLWNQYAAALTNGLSMKTNEISVIQNGGIPLPGSLAGGPLVGSTGGLMKLDLPHSHSGLPASMAEMEKSGSDGMAKSQFPHFMEEGKIAVN